MFNKNHFLIALVYTHFSCISMFQYSSPEFFFIHLLKNLLQK